MVNECLIKIVFSHFSLLFYYIYLQSDISSFLTDFHVGGTDSIFP